MKLKDQMDPKYTRISVYVIVTAVIIYLLFHAAGEFALFIGALGRGIAWLFQVLTPVFWAFMLAYLLQPLTAWLERRFEKLSSVRRKKRSARSLAVTVTCLIVLTAAVTLFSVIISAVTSELQVASLDSVLNFFNSIVDTIKTFYAEFLVKLSSMNINSQAVQNYVDQIANSVGSWISGLGSDLGTNANRISDFFTNLLFTLIFAIYFLADGDHIRAYWGRVFRALFGDRAAAEGKSFLKVADRVFSGYFRGQMIDALFMAAVISVSLSLVGVKFSVIIGVLAGIGNLIPYVGPFIAYASTIVVCMVSGDLVKMGIALVVLFIVQGIDGNIVNPKLLGSNVNIHPMYVIIALIVGESAAGLVGMLFAVPVAALVKEIFDRGVSRALSRRIRKESPDASATKDVN